MKFIPIFLTALLMLGCATSYQKEGLLSGGYSDVQLDESTYRVTFTGNGYSTKEDVENMLLYRAAEITDANGFDWFTVNERDSDEEYTFQLNRIKLTSTAVIKMYKGTKPQSATRAYDAKSVIQYLGRSIKK
jgi:hypothetical protein